MSNEHERFMLRAIALAEENAASGLGGPFGCVIVRDGTIIAEGTNRVTSSHDPTAHAEIVAIRSACRSLDTFQLTGCDVYASCEPCPMCMGAIYWARPRRVFYAASQEDAAGAGFDDAVIRDQLTARPEERSLPIERIMGTEGIQPFEAWKAYAKKVRY